MILRTQTVFISKTQEAAITSTASFCCHLPPVFIKTKNLPEMMGGE